jgi:predicted DNA binding CopG/RHH family protein
MKKFLQILIISFATLVLVANNVVFQYEEKTSIVAFDDQDDNEESKSEKNDTEQKVKDFLNIINSTTFTYKFTATKTSFFLFDNNQLPSILLDVELLPPNLS